VSSKKESRPCVLWSPGSMLGSRAPSYSRYDASTTNSFVVQAGAEATSAAVEAVAGSDADAEGSGEGEEGEARLVAALVDLA
jgi:hypothetical protein